MKTKIYKLLKQEYSHLGLGEEILQGQAALLAKTGLVTDTNLESIVMLQKEYLEDLQKLNDKRVAEATETARKKAKKEFEETQKKKEEEAKVQAEAEAKKKSEEEARAKVAEEEAKKKAEEEAKRRKELEEGSFPEALKKILVERDEQAKNEWEQSQKAIADMMEQFSAKEKAFNEFMEKTQSETRALLDKYNAMKEENEKNKADIQKRQRQDFILSKAKELNIPQYRIDEGFNIKDGDDDGAIEEYLTKVSNNIKANLLPTDSRQQLDLNDKPSQEEIAELTKRLVR